MTNRFRTEKIDEEIDLEVIMPEKEKAELPGNFVTTFFNEGMISKEAATAMLPFIIYIALLGMFYIANRHFAEKNIRDIDKLSREVKEQSWDYKTLKSDLMLKSTQTEVAKRVDTLGLKELIEPPQKIIIKSEN
jgi:hypothetical protein